MHDHWGTPLDFYAVLDAEFHFDHDPCKLYATNGLDENVPWGKCNFVNPPYSKRIKDDFVCRAVDEMENNGNTSVMLLPVSTSTKLWHNVIQPNATEIRFVQGRLRFLEHGKTVGACARNDSVVVVFKGDKK